MCYYIEINPGRNLTKTEFNNIWAQNQDGAGILIRDGEISTRIYKTLDKKQAKEILHREKNYTRIVHFRFGTSGAVNIEAVHPIDIGFAHFFHRSFAAILGTDEKSDTQVMADILSRLKTEQDVYHVLPILLADRGRGVIVPKNGAIKYFGDFVRTKYGTACGTIPSKMYDYYTKYTKWDQYSDNYIYNKWGI